MKITPEMLDELSGYCRLPRAVRAMRSVKAEAWFTAATWLAGSISLARNLHGRLTSAEQHIVDAVIPSLMRRAAIIERNRRK